MFYKASKFNETVGNWNTSEVKTMFAMFAEASLFNQRIGNWDTGNVTDIAFMFAQASLFNQCLGEWARTPANVFVDQMFEGLNCNDTSVPDPTKTPWCRDCS